MGRGVSFQAEGRRFETGHPLFFRSRFPPPRAVPLGPGAKNVPLTIVRHSFQPLPNVPGSHPRHSSPQRKAPQSVPARDVRESKALSIDETVGHVRPYLSSSPSVRPSSFREGCRLPPREGPRHVERRGSRLAGIAIVTVPLRWARPCPAFAGRRGIRCERRQVRLHPKGRTPILVIYIPPFVRPPGDAPRLKAFVDSKPNVRVARPRQRPSTYGLLSPAWFRLRQAQAHVGSNRATAGAKLGAATHERPTWRAREICEQVSHAHPDSPGHLDGFTAPRAVCLPESTARPREAQPGPERVRRVQSD